MVGRRIAEHRLLTMHHDTQLHLRLGGVAVVVDALHEAEQRQRGVVVVVFHLHNIAECKGGAADGGPAEDGRSLSLIHI